MALLRAHQQVRTQWLLAVATSTTNLVAVDVRVCCRCASSTFVLLLQLASLAPIDI
jgi:hypothetical protein